MPDQETLLLGVHGLWTAVVDKPTNTINRGAWLLAVHETRFVGTCTCGDYLQPLPAHHIGQRTDYEARCRTCTASVCAPGGRLARSSRGR